MLCSQALQLFIVYKVSRLFTKKDGKSMYILFNEFIFTKCINAAYLFELLTYYYLN